MRSLAWGTGAEPVRLAGAVGVRAGRFGDLPTRLTAEAEAQIADPRVLAVAGMPAGVRLEVLTDSAAVELDLHVTVPVLPGAGVIPAVVDLEVAPVAAPVGGISSVAGVSVRSVEVVEVARLEVVDLRRREMRFVDGPTTTIRFDGLQPGGGGRAEQRLTLWLPHAALVEVVDVRVDEGATAARPAPPPVRWVHHGSSISHCVEARRPTETWPAAVARRFGLDLVNLGLAGQAHLDQFAARTLRETAPDLISLKLGINVVNGDTLRERSFVPALHGFLDTIRDRLPATPILVVTPIICPIVEDHPGPTLSDGGPFTAVPRAEALTEGALDLRRIRELITEVVEGRVAGGDAHLALLDGLALFGPDDVDGLYDGLHPDADGYLTIAERFGDRVFAGGGLWGGRLVGRAGFEPATNRL